MNNNEAEGYAILAMISAGIKDKDIIKVTREMRYMFDMKTEAEAEEQGEKELYKIHSRVGQ